MVLMAQGQATPPDSAALFTQTVGSLFKMKCVSCHQGKTAAGGLDLTQEATAVHGGVHGPVWMPGNPDKSRLFQRISARQMPPNMPLAESEIAAVRTWIASGAVWPKGVTLNAAMQPGKRAGLDWWSLQKLALPAPPKVKNSVWVRNPIDAFVLAKLEAKGLRPSPPADRETLLRRVTFDLLGVPPTLQERAAFLNDRSPNAYEKLVDRLLADPRYGEQWGRHWLDVARFGESNGFERDALRPNAWRYRDYVIRAFNTDKPYAQFLQEQIAGDVLEPRTQEGVIATGFLIGGPWDEVGNSQVNAIARARTREEELEEMVGTVGQTFLGLTVNCARCHDHKFDPIPQTDYYRIKSALEGVRPADRPFLTPAESSLRDQKLATLKSRIRDLEDRIALLDRQARERVTHTVASVERSAPVPLAQWTFEMDARDQRGHLDGILEHGARVERGRLVLATEGAYLHTVPLTQDLKEKTLEAWIYLPNREQRGGGVLSVQTRDGGQFDAIVFGEREPGKWIAGSEFFRRTHDLPAPPEAAAKDALLHIAITYGADNRITVYRNGVPYAPPYTPTGENTTLRTFPAGRSEVLLGLRHLGAGNGLLTAEIEEARLYDRALSPAEVAASFRAGPEHLSEAQLQSALTPEERQQRATLTAECTHAEADLKQVSEPEMTYAANPVQPAPTCVLLRGDVQSPGAQVSAGGLSCITGLPSSWGLTPDAPEGERRRKLATWIADPHNPLPARVLVNRIWHYHFGRGLVATPNDFGFNGERPSHPELLDWLASAFLQHGGSIKTLHRLILLSNTYRQSSRFDSAAAAQDAEDRLLWRFALHRLEGEAVRDAMLCISGQLNPRMGGPSFRPFTEVVDNAHFYTLFDSDKPEFNRRTVYRMCVQSAKSHLLETLDCPDPSTKTPRRSITTTPLQALELMNNSFVLRQARYFADRVRKEAGPDLNAQVTHAYLLAFGRVPLPAEKARAVAFTHENGLESFCWSLFNASEFLYIR